ncbi:MAG: FkbM family methyltransferase [Burkholderiales bacterium]
MSHTKALLDEALDKVSRFEFDNPKYLEKVLGNYKGNRKIVRKIYFYFLRYSLFRKYISPLFRKERFRLIREINLNFERFDSAYEMLYDLKSKETFDWYIKSRIVTTVTLTSISNIIFPPFITAEDFIALENSLKEVENDIYEIEGFKIKVDKICLVCDFIIQQYSYYDIIKPEKGDIVIDGGGYLGDTALWFSKYIGEEGKVFCFEPFDSNFSVLIENINNNNIKNIISEKFGLWSKETILKIKGTGGGASVSKTGSNINVVSIDKFVKDNKLQKVDFIKMDIEGAELEALKGCQQTIKKFKPKLAICIYHRPEDIIVLLEYVTTIMPDYKIMLKSNSFGFTETIMYAGIF